MSDPVRGFEVEVVVEIPRGSRNKYEVDDQGVVRLDRRIRGPVAFPADYGYLPDTVGPDGDALDTLVLLAEPAFPGVRVRSRPIGAYRLEIDGDHEDKMVCVAVSDPSYDGLPELESLGEAAVVEIGAFFRMYRELEHGGTPQIARHLAAAEAQQVIVEARRAYQADRG